MTNVIRCNAYEMDERRRSLTKGLCSKADFNEWMSQRVTEFEAQERDINNPNANAVMTIPIIVHVIHNGDDVGLDENLSLSQINSQFEVLNEDFRRKPGTPGYNEHPDGADVRIEFCPARVDPNGYVLSEPGVNRINAGKEAWSLEEVDNVLKPSTYWNPDKYLNVWTVKFKGGGLLGYAQFPDTSDLDGLPLTSGPASTDGVVINHQTFGRVGNVRPPYNKGRTTTHEVGHWLGLIHIWGDGGCNKDDFCDDTPLSGAPNGGCPTGLISCGNVNMVENYMDYTHDACMNIFTENQKMRMRAVMNMGVRRKNLVNSDVCNVPEVPPSIDFTTNLKEGCPGVTIEFEDKSGFGPSSWQWNFPGGIPSSSTERNPVVVYPSVGQYPVTLTATNPFGKNTVTRPEYIQISDDAVSIFFQEDFEGESLSDMGWELANPDKGVTWDLVSVGGFRVPSQAAWIHIYNYNKKGQRDGLVSPRLDFSNNSNVYMTFDHSYRQYSEHETDSIIVYVSIDDGQTFPYRVFSAPNDPKKNNLITNVPTDINFMPVSKDDWCFGSSTGAECFRVDLGAFDGQKGVRVKFECYNNYSNNMFIDNVRLYGNCVAGQAGGSATLEADFSADVSGGCRPVTIKFADQSTGNPLKWEWSFPGGKPATSTSRNPTVSYDTPGAYDVILKVTNIQGTHVLTYPDFVSIYDVPHTNATSRLADCGASNGYINGNPFGGKQPYSMVWSMGGHESDYSVNTVPAGTYSVQVVDANGCESEKELVIVGEKTGMPPRTDFSHIASGFSAFFTDKTIGGGTYKWDFGDGTTSSDQNPTHQYRAKGTYTAKLRVTSNCGTDLATHTVKITGQVSSNAPNQSALAGQIGITERGIGKYQVSMSRMGKAKSIGVRVLMPNKEVVYKGSFKPVNGSLDLNVDFSPFALPGEYTLELKSGRAVTTKPLVVQ